MTTARIALCLSGLVAAPSAHACWCDHMSERMVLAAGDSFLRLHIETAQALSPPDAMAGADLRRVSALVRGRWLGAAPGSARVEFRMAGPGVPTDDCGGKWPAPGSDWLVEVSAQDGGYQFGACSASRHWLPALEPVLDRLAAEFGRRRAMDERDWEAALVLLVQPARGAAGLGAATCDVRLGPQDFLEAYRAMRLCVQSKLDAGAAFSAVIEEPYGDTSWFTAIARSPAGELRGWRAILAPVGHGELRLDAATLSEERCRELDVDIRSGFGGFCRPIR